MFYCMLCSGVQLRLYIRCHTELCRKAATPFNHRLTVEEARKKAILMFYCMLCSGVQLRSYLRCWSELCREAATPVQPQTDCRGGQEESKTHVLHLQGQEGVSCYSQNQHPFNPLYAGIENGHLGKPYAPY